MVLVLIMLSQLLGMATMPQLVLTTTWLGIHGAPLGGIKATSRSLEKVMGMASAVSKKSLFGQ